MESWYLSPSQQTVSVDKNTGFVQSKSAHETTQKPSLDSPLLWQAEQEVVWNTQCGQSLTPHGVSSKLQLMREDPCFSPGVPKPACKWDLKAKPRQLHDTMSMGRTQSSERTEIPPGDSNVHVLCSEPGSTGGRVQ